MRARARHNEYSNKHVDFPRFEASLLFVNTEYVLATKKLLIIKQTKYISSLCLSEILLLNNILFVYLGSTLYTVFEELLNYF